MKSQESQTKSNQNSTFEKILAEEANPKVVAWVEKRLAKLARKARKQEKKQGFCRL